MRLLQYKQDFLAKHPGEYHIATSPINPDDSWSKTYTIDDGSVMIEVNRPVWKTFTETFGESEVRVEVKLLETEVWNTDNASSVKFYEQW